MHSSKKSISRRQICKTLAYGSPLLLLPNGIPLNLENQMQKRKIPSTGEQLPIVGLGTWQTFDVGQSNSDRQPLKDVLKILVEHGGSLIDSSPMYGRSEQVVGELTTELQLKDKIFEATKVWTNGAKQGIEQMQKSMNLMQVQPMDLMQIHNLLDWKTHIKTLKTWKEQGKIRYIGITHYHSGAYREVEQIMKTEPLDFVQINYNLQVRGAADRILPLAKDKGIAVIINRPYESGSLFGIVKGKTLPDWALEFDARSWGQFFLKFILAHPAVNCVIPGTSKPHHMRDNVQAGFGKLPTYEHQKKMIELVS